MTVDGSRASRRRVRLRGRDPSTALGMTVPVPAGSDAYALGTLAVLAQSEVGTVDAYGPKLLRGLGDAQILMGFGLIDEMCYAGACVEKQ